MWIKNEEVFQLHAELCKVLANPKRLMILALLARREMSVGEIVEALDTPLANVSQHLRVLRIHNIVQYRKEGQSVYYSLSDRRVVVACTMIRSILLDDLKRQGKIAAEVNVDSLVEEG